MSFIPPEDSIFEDGSSNVRSFEIVNIAKGDDCTFRAWADLPDDQQSDDVFYLNITANSRLAEDQPFTYSANSSFEAVDSVKKESSVIASLGSVVSNIGELIWIWKWIIMAFCVS